MTDYRSNLSLEAAAAMIRDAGSSPGNASGASKGSVVLFTHAKPDGDAFGSVLALAAALKALGKPAHACLIPPIQPGLRQLEGQELYVDRCDNGQLPADPALIVICDTGAWSQLGPARAYIESRLDRTLILDHHLNGDVPAAHKFIDSTAAAACEIVADLIDHLIPTGAPGSSPGNASGASAADLDHRLLDIINHALFVGIASDTGWFKFSNATPRTHRLAARLLERGVNHTDLYAKLEQSERPQKLALLIRAVDSLKLLADGRAAIMTLRSEDFEQTGALEEETERLIDIPQQVGSIEVIVLIVEKSSEEHGGGQGITRMSFRSKPGPDAVNVAELAAKFGGGGHARAAGAKVNAHVDDIAPQVEQALLEAMAGQ